MAYFVFHFLLCVQVALLSFFSLLSFITFSHIAWDLCEEFYLALILHILSGIRVEYLFALYKMAWISYFIHRIAMLFCFRLKLFRLSRVFVVRF